MRGRTGTLIVVLVWFGMWGLLYIDGLFFLVPVVFGVAAALLAHYGRFMVYADPPIEDSLIYPPSKRKHIQHNDTVRVRRRKKTAESLAKECESLMAGFEDDPMRLEVLKAERDTAEREAKRLQDDLNRLVMSQRLEEKERKFKELTGGRS